MRPDQGVLKMTTHTDRAAKLYGSAVKPPAKPIVASTSPLYPKTKPGQSGSHAQALASTFDRLEAFYRNDPEKLSRAREQRQQLAAFLPTSKVDPQDAQELLSIHFEHVVRPRDEEARQKRWTGPAGYESVRLDAGSTEAANERIAAANRALIAIEKVAPTLAQQMAHNGAAEHPRFIQIAAKYGAVPEPTTATTQEN
jgi:hypothetical protein